MAEEERTPIVLEKGDEGEGSEKEERTTPIVLKSDEGEEEQEKHASPPKVSKPTSQQQQSQVRRRQASPRTSSWDDDDEDEDNSYTYKYQKFRTNERRQQHHRSDYDDDTPSWPMCLGIFLWIIMGITLIFVWYDEKFGLWDEVPSDIMQEEAIVQVNDDMVRPDF